MDPAALKIRSVACFLLFVILNQSVKFNLTLACDRIKGKGGLICLSCDDFIYCHKIPISPNVFLGGGNEILLEADADDK